MPSMGCGAEKTRREEQGTTVMGKGRANALRPKRETIPSYSAAVEPFRQRGRYFNFLFFCCFYETREQERFGRVAARGFFAAAFVFPRVCPDFGPGRPPIPSWTRRRLLAVPKPRNLSRPRFTFAGHPLECCRLPQSHKFCRAQTPSFRAGRSEARESGKKSKKPRKRLPNGLNHRINQPVLSRNFYRLCSHRPMSKPAR